VVVLLLTPVEDEGAQLELIADVARIFSKEDVRRSALDTANVAELLALLRTGQAA
jgi:mannitol/fructose-specific phosphotransferase system IIA component (Ntr-type)